MNIVTSTFLATLFPPFSNSPLSTVMYKSFLISPIGKEKEKHVTYNRTRNALPRETLVYESTWLLLHHTLTQGIHTVIKWSLPSPTGNSGGGPGLAWVKPELQPSKCSLRRQMGQLGGRELSLLLPVFPSFHLRGVIPNGGLAATAPKACITVLESCSSLERRIT